MRKRRELLETKDLPLSSLRSRVSLKHRANFTFSMHDVTRRVSKPDAPQLALASIFRARASRAAKNERPPTQLFEFKSLFEAPRAFYLFNARRHNTIVNKLDAPQLFL